MAFDFESKPFEEHKKWPTKKIIVSVLLIAVVIGIVFAMRNVALSTGAVTTSSTVKSGSESLAPLVISSSANVPVTNQVPANAVSINIIGRTNLLSLILDLRQAHQKKNIIDAASLVTSIDYAVDQIKNSAVSQSWETLALCLASSCSDVQFLEFVRVIALQGGTAHNQLILEFMTADKYWNTENTVRFSEAVTNVNNEVQRLNKTSLVSAWKSTIDCSGSCSSKTSVMFEFLEELR